MLDFDPSNAFLAEFGLDRADVAGLEPWLAGLRDEICKTDASVLNDPSAQPAETTPLDASFFELPEQLLAEYETGRQASHLGQILSRTKQLMADVDAVVVLGPQAWTAGPQALLGSCCQPYFNQLSRGQRGSRPRIYFASNSLANDDLQGLLHLLGAHRGTAARNVEESWGLVWIDAWEQRSETQLAWRLFSAALQTSCAMRPEQLQRRLITLSRGRGAMHAEVRMSDCDPSFELPATVSGCYSVLSCAGLVPAALMGINVMQLLAGATETNAHFRKAQPGENGVLQYAAVNHLLETRHDCQIRVLNVWNPSLEAAGWWYEHLLSSSRGRQSQAAMPVSMVSPRDWSTRRAALTSGRRNKIVNNVIVEHSRFDPLAVALSTAAATGQPLDESIPAALATTIRDTSQIMRDAGRPSTAIRMPQVTEHAMGQFFQMLMLATVVEARMLGIDPLAPATRDAPRVGQARRQ